MRPTQRHKTTVEVAVEDVPLVAGDLVPQRFRRLLRAGVVVVHVVAEEEDALWQLLRVAVVVPLARILAREPMQLFRHLPTLRTQLPRMHTQLLLLR